MTTRILKLLLFLYPASYRHRYGEDWGEIIAWHRRTVGGARLAAARVTITMVADTCRALPEAYASLLGEWLTRWRRDPVRGTGAPSPGEPPTPRRPAIVRRMVDALRQDLGYGLRGLIRNPLFTIAAVASLALGIGANTAIFSVVNTVLLRPLPYLDPTRLTIVWNEFPTSGLSRLPLSGVELQALRERPGLFEDAAGIWATSRTVLGLDEPVTVPAALITPNFFSVLGVEPRLGRSFVETEAGFGAPLGVIVSDEFWRTQLGANPEVLKTTIAVEGQAAPILGVMAPGFKLYFPPDGGIPEQVDLYLALPWNLSVLPPAQHFLRVVGRLSDDVDLAVAQGHVTAVADEVRQTYSELQLTGDRFTVVPLHGDTVRSARPVLMALLGGVGLFLLLASTNVASLVLARTSTRGREMAVRASLGASRGRLVHLLTVESLLLAGLGGAAGLWLGRQGATLLWTLRPEGIARVDTIGLDTTVLVFTLVVAVIAGLIFGLTPLLHISRFKTTQGLRIGTVFTPRSSRRSRKTITAAEVAVGLVLLIGAALLGQTFNRLQQADIGFDPARLLTFKVALSFRQLPEDRDRARVARELERALGELPGVLGAGAGSHLPFADWANWASSAPPEGTAETDRETFLVDHRSVTPGYLDALGATVRQGRGFAMSDDHDRQAVVIIDSTYAARVYPGQDVVGRQLFATRYRDGEFTNTWAIVVGVIDDIRDRSPADPSGGQVYWPFAQSARWELTYVLRTAGDPRSMIDDVRGVVRAVDGNLAPSDFRAMGDYVQDATASTRFVVLLAALFSTLALVLAALGLYSVITYSTSQRSHELGLRIALGARERDILVDVLGEGLRVGLIGIVAGVLAAIGLTRFVETLLFEVSPTDPLTFLAVSLAFLGITLLASIGPAYRATHVDPVVSMRRDVS